MAQAWKRRHFKESYGEYRRLFTETQGFDTNSVGRKLCGGIAPFSLAKPNSRLEVTKAAVFAVKHHNKTTNSDLQITHIIKANGQSVGGFMYYITFRASSLTPPSSKVYQAKVWHKPGGQFKVEVFRERPRPPLKKPNSIPHGAFLCFRVDVCKVLQSSHWKKPTLHQITKLASRVWRSMSTEAKLKYYKTRSLKYEDVAPFESEKMREMLKPAGCELKRAMK